MKTQALDDRYKGYIDCLNRQEWANLGEFVADDVQYNGQHVGLSGYQTMLEADFRAIPDLRFIIDLLITEPPRIAARLCFDCTPAGELFGLPVNGRRVSFSENVFYEFREGRVCAVWSVIDKAAVQAQLVI